jgi:fructose-1,6-bisphosphatase/inositol monophosphatase family enzyme
MEYRAILLDAAILAGKTMLKHDSKVLKKKYQGWQSRADVVTAADVATEKALRKFFAKRLPEFNIFGEELGGKYNGNGKCILIDPIDGTLGFSKGLPIFGTIIGIYENGRNVAGVEYNVRRNKMCIATKNGMEYLGEEKKRKRSIYFGDWGIVDKKTTSAVKSALRKEFKEFRIIGECKVDYTEQYDVLVKAMVFNELLDGLVVLKWSRHDIAASPIMAKLSGVKITNHRGKPYNIIDFRLEEKRYKSNDKDWIYSCPVIIAKPNIHARLLKALQPFRKELDGIFDYRIKP